MVYDPSALTIRERILRNIEAALATIAPPEYANTIAKVMRYDANAVTRIQAWPAAIVHPGSERHNDNRLALVEHEMDVEIGLVVQGQDWSAKAETLLADARVALTEDYSRGGIALTTRILGSEVFDAGASTPTGLAQLSVQVLYRTRYEDPTTAG